ncbi:MAG: alpha-E domain-containing protein [Firmicutes bacterium]|nr:alpha-E domain-containing protein [[Eubacterium] siraeum]MCM1487437.1 alpha-E domain-containing protein [Bacillota bacterium]
MGTISIDHSDRLFWLGRYTERAFTTLKALEALFDKAIDGGSKTYRDYLDCFGLLDGYADTEAFMQSFLFDKGNQNSVAFSLEKAYDNGIVLREGISTEALSFLQLAKDTLAKAERSCGGYRYELLPLEDVLFGFWGCINDYVYDSEALDIIKCGKYIERLDLYFRMKYPFNMINLEFDRLCESLRKMPKNTPYRYNTEQLSVLVETVGMREDYVLRTDDSLSALSKLFETAPQH